LRSRLNWFQAKLKNVSIRELGMGSCADGHEQNMRRNI
jgi:hypothetical protein